MPVFKYEGLYLGQLYAYQTRPEEPQIRFAGSIHVQLAVSRDGIGWERVGGRKSFIPNGPPGSIDTWEVMTATQPVVMGDELWFYYCATALEHGFTGRSGPICLAKLRLDGFVSVDAGDETSTLVTKPFRCEGGQLSINAAARGGMVGVAVLDESGTQFQGYSRQDVRALRRRLRRAPHHVAREGLPGRADGQGHPAQVLLEKRESVRVRGELGVPHAARCAVSEAGAVDVVMGSYHIIAVVTAEDLNSLADLVVR